MDRIYLDDAGSAPVGQEVRDAVAATPWANPSSPHREGRAARAAMDAARDRAARALGAQPQDLAFCASGTQAVNLALLGAGRRLAPGRSLVTWTHEHQSVLGAARQLQLEGVRVHLLGPDRLGRADPEAMPADAGLVSLGMANNEVGSLQPVSETAERAHRLGALFHLDACQGPRWLRPPLEICDLASFSGTKSGAGGGGLLFAAPAVRLDPLWFGGPQEFGRVAGREDPATAAAMSAALELCARDRELHSADAAGLVCRLGQALVRAGGVLTGAPERLPNHASACFADGLGEDLVLALDLAGIAASSGSACASGSLDPSHVLLAMGYSLREAGASLRLSVGWDTRVDEVDRAIEIMEVALRHGRG